MEVLAQIQRDKIQFYKIEFIPTEKNMCVSHQLIDLDFFFRP